MRRVWGGTAPGNAKETVKIKPKPGIDTVTAELALTPRRRLPRLPAYRWRLPHARPDDQVMQVPGEQPECARNGRDRQKRVCRRRAPNLPRPKHEMPRVNAAAAAAGTAGNIIIGVLTGGGVGPSVRKTPGRPFGG